MTVITRLTSDDLQFKKIYENKMSKLNIENWFYAWDYLYVTMHNKELYYSIIDDYLCIFINKNGQMKLFYAPIGEGNADKVIDRVKEGMGVDEIVYVYDGFQTKYKCSPKYGDDYVYDLQRIVELKGQHYKNIRNKINSFKKHKAHQFRVAKETDIEEINRLVYDWKKGQGIKYFRVFDTNLTKVGLIYAVKNIPTTYVAVVNGIVKGFITGNMLTNNMCFCFIGKADTNIVGLSDYMMVEFYRQFYIKGCKYGNDGSDVGYKGLHEFKEKYLPVRRVKNYYCVLEKKKQEGVEKWLL